MACLLGLDIGTTSTIGIVLDTGGKTLAKATRPSELLSKRPNWAEEDPALWWRNSCEIVTELLSAAGIGAGDLAAVGVTGMVPTVILLDGDGCVLRHSIQQNDARAIREIAEMKQAIAPDIFFAKTGGSINQQLVAPKLRWIERHEPEIFARARRVFGSYDYITYRLTGSASVEHNWALESGLLDIETGDFDAELVRLGGIAPDLLPPVRRSHEVVGAVTRGAAKETGLRADTPVVAGCADHIASAFVAGAVNDGDLVIKFGGAGDIMLSSSKPVADPRLFIDYHIIPDHYFSNGCMAASGSVLNWILRHLAVAEARAAEAKGISAHAHMDRLAAGVPPGADGLVLLPYFLGEKTPLHDPNARGTLIGLGLHHGLPHIWRAALEAVAFGFRHHIEVFEEIGLEVTRVSACDGGAASDLWLQITADVLNRPIERLLNHPGSSLGAAFVAGMGVGVLDDWGAIARFVPSDRVFEPDPRWRALYDDGYGIYRETYQRLETLYPRLAALSPE